MASCFVVAGNGRSLTQIAPGRILATDRIVRTNNFFFEDHLWLGPRVDMAMIGGDPRVAPFLFETLWRHGKDYDLRGWSSQDTRVARAGRRRFGALYQPLRYRDHAIETAVCALVAKYQRKPTTGTYATLMAHGLGAETILLAGMDLHTGPTRYAYTPGRHYAALMGHDLNRPGPNAVQHDPDLDRAILETLLARDDVQILRVDDTNALAEQLDLAPLREGPTITPAPRQAPRDWVGRVGAYPISLLKMLRRASATLRAAPKE